MRVALVVVAVAQFVTLARGQESLPLKSVAAIKEATVMIITDGGADRNMGGSGTGFLIRVQGQTGFVATNNHVISHSDRAAGIRGSVTVVLRCGSRSERKVPAEVVAASPESDLAVLKIVGVPDFPAPIDVSKATEPVETTPVYIFGFPFGLTLAAGHGKPSVVVGKGSVSSVRSDAGGRVSVVLIDAALNPGDQRRARRRRPGSVGRHRQCRYSGGQHRFRHPSPLA